VRSRWANASREDLEALAEHCDQHSQEPWKLLDRLRASCPPLRTESEVAAEALAILRQWNGTWMGYDDAVRLRVLAKEPTRD
jgi:hypothetical protein